MLVITSVYNDSYNNVLDFVIKHDFELIVYIKKDNLKLGEEIVRKITDKLTIIEIPNYGRCDYAFLYYIITFYDKLPLRILFTKANFMDQNIELDYALVDRSFMLIGKHLKIGILNKNFNTENLDIDKDDIECLYLQKNNYTDNKFQSYLTNDFYNMVYDNKPFSDDYVINFGHGPCFCVSRDYILAHQLSVYVRLIDSFYPNKNHWSTWYGHTDEETYMHVGMRYHDNLQRFWILLFVQNYSNNNIETDFMNVIQTKT